MASSNIHQVQRTDVATGRRYWTLLLLVAIFLRVFVSLVLLDSTKQTSDALHYVSQSQRMLEEFPGDRPYFWPPGRSYFLLPSYLAFGVSETVTNLNAIFIDVVNVILVAIIAHSVFTRNRSARIAGWLAAAYPPAVMLSGWAYAHNLAMLFLLSSCLLLILVAKGRFAGLATRLTACFFSGLFLGCAILTRPSALSVLAAIVVGGLFIAGHGFLRRMRRPGVETWKHALACTAILACGSILPMLFAMRHNASLDEGWVVATNTEMNLFYGNNRYTPHYKTWHWAQRDRNTIADKEVREYYLSFSERPDAREAWKKEALQYIARRPDIFLYRTVNRMRCYWGFDYYASRLIQNQNKLGTGGLIPLLCFEAGGYVIVMLLVLAGLFLARGRGNTSGMLLLLYFALAYMAPYTLVFSSGTYHIPIMGLLLPFAGMTADELTSNFAETWRKLRSNWFFALLVVVFILIQCEYAYHIFYHFPGS